jgi:Putative metal-binding motif
VTDGGFDAATCNASDCTSTAWSETTAGTAPIGPICRAGTGNCADGSGTGYSTGPGWARLGAGLGATTSVSQRVQIPAAPAKLVFFLHITAQPNGTDALSVTIDGTQVFSATDATPGYAFYTRVEVDVSRFAGGARTLRFQGTNNAAATPSDSFDVDEVSLDAAEAPPPPNRDVDGDNYIGSQFGGPDCNDTNAAIHPGVTDVPHDGIDQDCNNRDAPYPRVRVVTPRFVTAYSPRFANASKWYARVTLLVVRAPAGATVTISCSRKGGRCPFKRKTVPVKSARKLKLTSLKRVRLKNHTVISVRVTKPGFIGNLYRYEVRVFKGGRRTTRCLQPGETRPRKTCA